MSDNDIERYRRNFQDERDGASLYAALAAAERDPVRKDLFMQLSQAEAGHAEVWRARLAARGIADPAYVPSLRTRLLMRLARRFGPRFVLPSVAAAEFADRDKYAGQADAAALSSEERGHAAVVQAAAGSRGRGVSGGEIARAEPWHRGGSGNDLRAAVLGANDGLVSNFCLVMGVAGAGTGGREILLTGLAGLAAGACSMALGEWLSVTNARELAETQIAREREEIEQTPAAEQKELALIFQAKGIDRADAQRIAAEIMRDKDVALDTLAREELGIDPAERGGNPWRAAITSFALFAAGAICPVLPFVWSRGAPAIAISIALSAAALAAIGFVTSLFSGRTPLYSALRQVLIGCAAAAVTYGAGMLFGVSLS
ncbi:VIT1/CCC1 transporter family protein [Solimonas soli]|uniref:VIT1/CCC1 transporter family protein n=1 Tax=Solimonas soli TaxID=413479 RepID=UPI000482965C|nr:VIT1/CCC1 transporter family protein [Solimonas soli]